MSYLVVILYFFFGQRVKITVDPIRHFPHVALGWLLCVGLWYIDQFALAGDFHVWGYAGV